MKKTLSLLMTAILALSCFAFIGCGGSSKSGNTDVEEINFDKTAATEAYFGVDSTYEYESDFTISEAGEQKVYHISAPAHYCTFSFFNADGNTIALSDVDTAIVYYRDNKQSKLEARSVPYLPNDNYYYMSDDNYYVVISLKNDSNLIGKELSIKISLTHNVAEYDENYFCKYCKKEKEKYDIIKELGVPTKIFHSVHFGTDPNTPTYAFKKIYVSEPGKYYVYCATPNEDHLVSNNTRYLDNVIFFEDGSNIDYEKTESPFGNDKECGYIRSDFTVNKAGYVYFKLVQTKGKNISFSLVDVNNGVLITVNKVAE